MEHTELQFIYRSVLIYTAFRFIMHSDFVGREENVDKMRYWEGVPIYWCNKISREVFPNPANPM